MYLPDKGRCYSMPLALVQKQRERNLIFPKTLPTLGSVLKSRCTFHAVLDIVQDQNVYNIVKQSTKLAHKALLLKNIMHGNTNLRRRLYHCNPSFSKGLDLILGRALPT